MRVMIATLSVAAVGLVGALWAAVDAEVDAEPRRLVYDVVGLEGKLFLEVEPDARRLEVGDHAVSGDRLRTASSTRAQLDVASHASHFLLGPKTRCTLAHDRPGVLLHVERGRLRGIFDAFSGTDPRLVTTPSAVLAVRGTEYGVQVAKDGDTRLVVFDGVVEVLDPAGIHEPIRVEAGHQTRIVEGQSPEAPRPHRIDPADWDRGRTGPAPGVGDGNDSGFPGSMPGSSSAGSKPGQGGSKRHGG